MREEVIVVDYVSGEVHSKKEITRTKVKFSLSKGSNLISRNDENLIPKANKKIIRREFNKPSTVIKAKDTIKLKLSKPW